VINGLLGTVTLESLKERAAADHMRFARPDDLSMSAVHVVNWIGDDTSRDRVEMDVGDNMAEVLIGVDHARPVSALPESAKELMPPVVSAGNASLQPRHRSPQGDIVRLENQMVVVSHQTPCVDRPGIEVSYLAQCLYKLLGLIIVVEYELAASDAAVDMVGRSRNEQAGMSRHGTPPMRGRDDTILPTTAHNATMVNVVPIRTWLPFLKKRFPGTYSDFFSTGLGIVHSPLMISGSGR
jgi:hypothetical protein